MCVGYVEETYMRHSTRGRHKRHGGNHVGAGDNHPKSGKNQRGMAHMLFI